MAEKHIAYAHYFAGIDNANFSPRELIITEEDKRKARESIEAQKASRAESDLNSRPRGKERIMNKLRMLIQSFT